MIDNYDSFVYNLVAYFQELGQECKMVRNDEINLKTVGDYIHKNKIKGIILSPGPKHPKDSGICLDIVRKFKSDIPILGVCLGHQIMGYVFGAQVIKAPKPMHGKISQIHHKDQGLFHHLPPYINVTRYHSLIVNRETLPEEFSIDAETEDGLIMAMSHKDFPLYSVQFHPEAVLTEHGHRMIDNFIQLSKNWRGQ